VLASRSCNARTDPQRAVSIETFAEKIRNTHAQSDGRKNKTQISVCSCGSLNMLRETCFPPQGPAKKGKKACLWWGRALPSKYGSVFTHSCRRLKLLNYLLSLANQIEARACVFPFFFSFSFFFCLSSKSLIYQ